MSIVGPLPRLRLPWWQVLLAAALALGGFAAATQVRTELSIQRQVGIPSTRLSELAVELQRQEQYREKLEAEVGRLRGDLAALERRAAEGQVEVARMNRDLRSLRTLAGFVPLEGPGVVVEMSDSPAPIQPGEDPNKTILHYTDIHAVINDLWAGGADAIAVNGERIITRTGVSCVGTTILCNTKRVAPPYRIAAIGDPARLLRQVNRPGGPAELLRAFRFPLRAYAADRVRVPAYRGIFSFTLARPIGAGSGP
ncbi:MAG TPA: DUF881 domain-containing protein [bacterium]|jgi:uncharacterized protein YlxW (UPF0749 family)|nr:DUF881 domain-containing protein [bacterium]